MGRLPRDGTAEPVSRDRILRRERGNGKNVFFSSVGNEQDWQPDPVDPYSAESADHTYPNHAPSSSSTYARMPNHGITPP